jgi:hypothetical protein
MRIVLGAIACALYFWRIQDPKGSYAAFYDAANWSTDWLIADGGLSGMLKNVVNMVLLDQADGFLLGIAFSTLLSLLFWPFRAAGRWSLRSMKRRPRPASSSELDGR